ncbi:single-stranded-DNA-specific exonuclease RecJ [Parafannyhessea umbonata]|uniref:Single-stranded-DNA-specific exonuclease RecJ n=1 Tax=Parafannyhessea umbonata TaxID=604330 RepID=A0A1H9P0N6_9ACTN|nr:single-stranded-DNA-specific exonuclease RecJ [Parafannyhessea umbonata]SER41389.1 single-stranded-DNA-specific exonuclease [Parafannyhessea umbonata]
MTGIETSRRWELLPQDPEAEKVLQRECGVSAIVARTMAARGITSVDEARRFLTPSLERDWADPLVIPGMGEACDRVESALDQGQRIAVFGDFDVDGMSATCLLTLALRELGGDVYPFIPHRFGEGYGLSLEALSRVIEGCDPELIITVDNGIAARGEVAWLRGHGIDVVVTDHHEPAELVPEGVPVTDPKLEPGCVSRELAGAGVALKMVHELGRRKGRPELWRDYTEVATLGTVSDMMLLTGENRALVCDGIASMRHTRRPGLLALAATAGVDISSISADELPFSLVPRLNAAGRMGSTDTAFDLLIADDHAQAAILAASLEETNHERRDTESALTDAAMEQVQRIYDGSRVIVVAGEGWHEGVKGIVASRITNRYHVPSIVFSVKDGVARGSGRSVGSVDLFRAVEQCSDLLVRFGGHSGAVGVTCEADKLDEFRRRLGAVMAQLPAEDFEDCGEVTAVVGLDEMTVAGIDSLEVLQPFGQGNKKPLFAVCGVTMRNRASVGANGNHFRFVATDGFSSVPAIMFRAPDIERAVGCESVVDVVFEPVSETWQGKTKPKLMVKDIIYRDEDRVTSVPASEGEKSPATLADELFDRAESIISRDAYADIAQADRFMTKVVGVSFEGRQAVVESLSEGDELGVERDADNEADPNAVRVCASGAQIGYLRRQIAASLAPAMDAGVAYQARVVEVTGGEGDKRSLGVNIEVTKVSGEPEEDSPESVANRERERLSHMSLSELTDELRGQMIGEHSLLPAQQAAVDRLARGRSTLCVMATGRGKSLVFHIHAAREAILKHRASVFVYPLRALVSDQAFHLSESFGKLGMSVRVLTGETSQQDRDDIFRELSEGGVDVLLTTPEFLSIHVDRFAQSGRISFLVVDEAHHAGGAKGGNRSAYLSLPQVLTTLGNPVALAVTATAEDAVAHEICNLLSIDEDDVVVDASVRENLRVRDYRELRDREAALVSVVAHGMKTVVYVNSREQSVSLARMLRRNIPELAHRIAFYNAGLTRTERSRVEEAFRSGELICIVSTSAFGEGVNLPDIRNVMLYHMPFGSVEFNQMSGRAGRDGGLADVYLLFGARDARINERIIGASAPDRSDLVCLYRCLRSLSDEAREADGSDSFGMSNADIARRAVLANPRCSLDDHSVSCGVSVFGELGFLRTSGYGSARRIHMVDAPGRMRLEDSIRYLEGMRSRNEFSEFRDWVLSCSGEELLDRINKPITPAFGVLVS